MMKTNEQFRTECLKEAIDYLERAYPKLPNKVKILEYDDIQWSSTCSHAKFRLEPDKKGRYIRVNVKEKYWQTYRRVTIGIMANCIKVSPRVSLVTQLIHEITHYIQHLEGRKYSEVETTENEILYIMENHPYVSTYIIPIK